MGPCFRRDDEHPNNREASLTQRTLQIEAEIRRLPRFDRPVQPKDLAAKHVVRRTVDRLDADEKSGFVAKGRERSLGAVAAHHDAVVNRW